MPYSTDLDQLKDEDIICAKHLSDDSYLEELVADWIGDGKGLEPCTICGEPGWIVDGILPEIAGGVTKFYEAANDSGMIFEDGDFQGVTYTTEEVLDDVGIEYDHPLRWAVSNHIGADEAWVAYEHEWPSEYRLLADAWRSFSDHVKYRSRFLFETTPTSSFHGMRDQLGTEDFLQDLLSAVATQPVQAVDSTTPLYRARPVIGDADHPANVEDYTSPPRDYASQGRMNPAGVAYFYGALDPSTAAAEVYAPDCYAAVMAFTATRPLSLIDLTSVTLPSPFDDSVQATDHHRKLFTHQFVSDISKPIVRDGRVHRDYVPTQAVTEYIRFRTSPPVDGIMFKSARAQGTNVVIFADQQQCLGGPGSMLAGEPSIQVFSYDPPSVSGGFTRKL